MRKPTNTIDFRHLSVHEGPEDSPGFLLWRINMHWRTAIEGVLKPLGLTHPQFVVLATTGWLTRDKKPISQIDIARQAGIDPNTTSQIVRGLERKGLIKRAQKLNERNKNPTLTATGTEKLKKALPAVEKADAKFFGILSEKDLKILVTSMAKLGYQ